MKCDVIRDVKLFPTIYPRIYRRKVLTLSNQTSRYNTKCVRMSCNGLSGFKAAYFVTFDILILEIKFLFIKNTVKILIFR